MSQARRYSFEFFPPKTDAGRDKLVQTRQQLNQLGPDFFSVTYGAGGSTRENTFQVVKSMVAERIDTAPHLSFGGDDEATILELLQRYRDVGVKRIVALRGDMPSGMGASSQLVYAAELVAFIRRHFGDHFELEVAAYPEIHPDAPSYSADIAFLKRKFDNGASSAITQYFYNADAYFYYLEACRKQGIEAPIYPGIMPITNFANLARFSRNCGAELPRWLTWKLQEMGNDLEGQAQFGLEFVTRLCEQLLDGGAPGIHFYTMNQTEPTTTLWQSLGLPGR